MTVWMTSGSRGTSPSRIIRQTMTSTDYLALARHYEACLDAHGDTFKGVDWPNPADLQTRFSVMLDLLKSRNGVSLLDFGCGNGLLYEYIKSHNLGGVAYTGLDISRKFIDLCRDKYPGADFLCRDVLREPLDRTFDYIICNGTFTEKLQLSYDEMFAFMQEVLLTLFDSAARGIAFNVMSTHVDYEREDLFHLPHDSLADFVVSKLSRDYLIRCDYGLYEYTTYVYKR